MSSQLSRSGQIRHDPLLLQVSVKKECLFCEPLRWCSESLYYTVYSSLDTGMTSFVLSRHRASRSARARHRNATRDCRTRAPGREGVRVRIGTGLMGT